MTAKADLDTLTVLNTQLELLDPYSFHSRVAELKRGSLPRSSVPGGSRSSTTPMPALDDHDQWLIRCEHTYSEGIEQAARALRKALAAQNAVRLVMGFNTSTGDPEADAKMMRKARDKATELLTEEAEGQYRFICQMCSETFKRTKDQRPRGGKCRACNDWWTQNGRPEGGLPPWVLEARIDRRLTKESTA